MFLSHLSIPPFQMEPVLPVPNIGKVRKATLGRSPYFHIHPMFSCIPTELWFPGLISLRVWVFGLCSSSWHLPQALLLTISYHYLTYHYLLLIITSRLTSLAYQPMASHSTNLSTFSWSWHLLRARWPVWALWLPTSARPRSPTHRGSVINDPYISVALITVFNTYIVL